MRKIDRIANIQIDSSDYSLFEYLYITKGATRDQILRDVYKGLKPGAVYMRLRKFHELKFIDSNISRGLRCHVYNLSKNGYVNFIDNKSEAPVYLKSDKVDHDLVLVELRNIFLKSPKVLEYLSENQIISLHSYSNDLELQSIASMNSDGAIKMDLGNESTTYIPIEYEASQKSRSRNIALIDEYYKRDNIHFVFFIVRNEKIKNELIAAENIKINNGIEPKFLYLTMYDLIWGKKLKFQNARNETFEFGTLKPFESCFNVLKVKISDLIPQMPESIKILSNCS